MRFDSGGPRNRSLLAAIVALGLASAWPVGPAHADEHGMHEFREHQFYEHEFHDHRYLDARYHHDHYYPPVGFVFGALPHDYIAIGFGTAHFYFGAGVWYRAYAPGQFIVVAPPAGVVIPAPPPYYTIAWVRGVPYCYANNVYYVQTPQGYMVAAPPTPSTVVEQPPVSAPPPVAAATPAPAATPSTPTPAPATSSQQVFAYPLHDQSAQQQAKDRYECHAWAVGQTGLDPSRPPAGGASAVQSHDYRRAMAACLEARGYTVK